MGGGVIEGGMWETRVRFGGDGGGANKEGGKMNGAGDVVSCGVGGCELVPDEVGPISVLLWGIGKTGDS